MVLFNRCSDYYYLLLVLVLSPIGSIRLGKPGEEPGYSNKSWFAMLFSAGMGIGLVFWGAAEPLSHYAVQAPGGEVGTQAAMKDALRYSFFHWEFLLGRFMRLSL